MFYPPLNCPRGLDTCKPLSNIISDGEISFFCCGENKGMAAVEEDIYTVCFKGEHRDSTAFYDKRDLIHESAVIIQALAIVQAAVEDDKDWSPWDE